MALLPCMMVVILSDVRSATARHGLFFKRMSFLGGAGIGGPRDFADEIVLSPSDAAIKAKACRTWAAESVIRLTWLLIGSYRHKRRLARSVNHIF